MKEDFLDHLRIASPCGVGWDKMSGNDRKRFCAECNLHVYNISELTRAEVATLIATSSGRVCARLYRRIDGTVITRDCPVGLRRLRQRVARRAGAALATVMSLAAAITGQTRPQGKKSCSDVQNVRIERTTSPDQPRVISGVVRDPSGAPVPGVKITLIDEVSKRKLKTKTSDTGEFRFAGMNNNSYTLEVKDQSYQHAAVTHLRVADREAVRMEMILDVKAIYAVVGILLNESDYENSNGTTIIRGDMLRRFPLP